MFLIFELMFWGSYLVKQTFTKNVQDFQGQDTSILCFACRTVLVSTGSKSDLISSKAPFICFTCFILKLSPPFHISAPLGYSQRPPYPSLPHTSSAELLQGTMTNPIPRLGKALLWGQSWGAHNPSHGCGMNTKPTFYGLRITQQSCMSSSHVAKGDVQRQEGHQHCALLDLLAGAKDWNGAGS